MCFPAGRGSGTCLGGVENVVGFQYVVASDHFHSHHWLENRREGRMFVCLYFLISALHTLFVAQRVVADFQQVAERRV